MHDCDYNELCIFLRNHKQTSGLSISDISKATDRSISEVEHWFRKDEYFAPPPADVWNSLKELLNITDTKYDAFITEFEWVDGVYEMDKRAYGDDGLSPTLSTNGSSLMREIKVAGNLSNTGHSGNDVFDVDGISRTLTSSNYKHPLKIMENDSPRVVGNSRPSKHWGGNIYDENAISPTLCSGSLQKNGLKIRTNTKKGYDEVVDGDGVRLCHPTSTKARGRTQKGQTGALSTKADWGTLDKDFRIRKLTPLECERLQAFPDNWTKYGADGEEISDTQRYKCLGNAVTTTVVTYVANTMFGGSFEG